MAMDWQDNFSAPAGSPVDPAYWTATLNGGGGGNNELEYYTAESIQCDGQGHAVLTAKADNGSYPAWYGPSQYLSGKIWTKDKFEFLGGHVEVTATLPMDGEEAAPGAWP